jgi:hypothetical protein
MFRSDLLGMNIDDDFDLRMDARFCSARLCAISHYISQLTERLIEGKVTTERARHVEIMTPYIV